MLPRTHILLGAIFTLIFYFIFPQTHAYELALIFLSSFLIDFDHYAASIFEDRSNFNLFKSLKYHDEKGKVQANERKKGLRRKGSFHLFHTLEYHLLILILGIFVFKPFLYIFIGMTFHSLCDIFWLKKVDYLYRREFFLLNWISNKIKNKRNKKKK